MQKIDKLLGELVDLFRQHPGDERLQEFFVKLIRRRYAASGEKIPPPLALPKPQAGLAARVAEWIQQVSAQAWAQGYVEGKAEKLLWLLVGRFGAVAVSCLERIQGANLTTLERWIKRARIARDLPSVFEPSTRTVAFDLFPESEQEDFRRSCARWRKGPDEFLVKAEEPDLPSGSPGPIQREVTVVHLPSAKVRRYRAGSAWIAAFDDDLQAAYFSTRRFARALISQSRHNQPPTKQ